MKFLIDNQLPVRLAQHLRQHGHDAVHVLDLGIDEVSDIELWNLARREDMVLVSKDEDFVFLANRTGDDGKLVWVRLGNCRNPILLDAIDRVHDDLIRAFEAGQRIVEVR